MESERDEFFQQISFDPMVVFKSDNGPSYNLFKFFSFENSNYSKY